MEFAEVDGKQKLTFLNEEVFVMSAVYREFIRNKHRMGNPSTIHSSDIAISEWNGQRHTVATGNHEHLVDRLVAYHEDTSDEIANIPGDTGVAAFANRQIPRRHQLGEQALALAEEIEQKAAAYYEPIEIPDDLDMDSEFSSLLGGEPA